VHLFISPLVIATWRGAWQNVDTFMDEVIFAGDLKTSAAVALAVGVSSTVVFLTFKGDVDHFAKAGGRYETS
jgi:hypothetical protein